MPDASDLRRWEDRAELAARLEAHANVLAELVTKNPQLAELPDLAAAAREAADMAQADVGRRPVTRRTAERRRRAPDPANPRTNASPEAGWHTSPDGATPPGMANEEHEYISLAEAGRRIPRANGAPRSERTMQRWAARGLLPLFVVSEHVRFVDWTLYQLQRAGKAVTMGSEGASAPDTDTEE